MKAAKDLELATPEKHTHRLLTLQSGQRYLRLGDWRAAGRFASSILTASPAKSSYVVTGHWPFRPMSGQCALHDAHLTINLPPTQTGASIGLWEGNLVLPCSLFNSLLVSVNPLFNRCFSLESHI